MDNKAYLRDRKRSEKLILLNKKDQKSSAVRAENNRKFIRTHGIGIVKKQVGDDAGKAEHMKNGNRAEHLKALRPVL